MKQFWYCWLPGLGLFPWLYHVRRNEIGRQYPGMAFVIPYQILAICLMTTNPFIWFLKVVILSKVFLWTYFIGWAIIFSIVVIGLIKEFRSLNERSTRIFFSLVADTWRYEDDFRTIFWFSFGSVLSILFFLGFVLWDEYDSRREHHSRWNCDFRHLYRNNEEDWQ